MITALVVLIGSVPFLVIVVIAFICHGEWKMFMVDFTKAKENSRRDDWYKFFVGSDIREMIGEIERLRSENERIQRAYSHMEELVKAYSDMARKK